MDLDARLRAFAALVRAGSFTRAASELYISQPAVSKHVAALETEVHKRLVSRSHGAVRLTPAGQMLADYVLRAEALLANARRAIASGDDAQVGNLALAASGIPGTYLLPLVVARFHEMHPAVVIEFRASTSAEATEAVRAHKVEIAVVGGLTVTPELDAARLLDDEVVLVGAPSLRRTRMRAAELEAVTWISREEGSATRAAVEAARLQMGLRAVRKLELPSWEAVKLAVASGAGIAAISRFALEVELSAGRLVVLDAPRWKLWRTISLVTARDVPLTPPASRFVEALRQMAAGFPARPSTSRRTAGRSPRASTRRRSTGRA